MELLIPDCWFEGLHWALLLLLTLMSMAALVKGAGWLVEGASSLAYRLGMPKVIVGATIVALGTTSPECAVSVMAAWSGEPGLAMGNAVGSIIFDSGLIFGFGCLLGMLPADQFVLNRQGWVQFGAGVLLAAFCYIAFVIQGEQATLGQEVGVLMLLLLVVYLAFSVRWARQHPQGEPFQTPSTVAESTLATPSVQVTHSIGLMIVRMIVGLIIIIFASHVLIVSVSVLAQRWGVPETVIAGTLVAMGTSLPELVVGIMAIRKKHPELLVGNVIGADILNVLFVIGASSVAAPLPIIESGTSHPAIFLWLHLPAMLLILILFRCFIFAGARCHYFSKWNGVPLLLIYFIYVILGWVVGRF